MEIIKEIIGPLITFVCGCMLGSIENKTRVRELKENIEEGKEFWKYWRERACRAEAELEETKKYYQGNAIDVEIVDNIEQETFDKDEYIKKTMEVFKNENK